MYSRKLITSLTVGILCAVNLNGIETSEHGFSLRDGALLDQARKGLDEAVAYIDAHYSADDKGRAKLWLMCELCKERLDYVPSIPMVLSEGSIERDRIWNTIAVSWLKKDAKSVVAYCESLPSGVAKDELTTSVVYNFAHTDRFQEATSLVASLAAGVTRKRVMGDVARSQWKKDPKSVIEWLSKAPTHESNHILLRLAWDQMTLGDAVALELIGSAASGDSRNTILQMLGHVVGKFGKSRIEEQLRSADLPEKESGYVYAGALTTVPASDLEDILRLTLGSSDKAIRLLAVTGYLPRAIKIDPEHTMTFVNALPPDLFADSVRSLIVSSCSETPTNAGYIVEHLEIAKQEMALRILSRILRGSPDDRIERVLASFKSEVYKERIRSDLGR